MSRISLVIALLVLLPTAVWAHDPGLSSALGKIQNDRLELTIGFAIRDACQVVPLDANNDGQVTLEEFQAGRDQLAEVIATNCEVKCDGALTRPASVVCIQDDAKNVSVRLGFPVSGVKQADFYFPIIQLMPLGHRMFFSISGVGGKVIVERLLTANSTPVSVPLNLTTVAASAQITHTLPDFILMGMQHIGTGYDHLLFLFALLVVTPTFRSALTVITAFTIAHSITLAIATFNLVTIPPNLSEALIAATIVYVGLENLWRHGEPHKRWLLTFSFGLIHGFGFASVLRSMGIGRQTGGVLVPLLGFNLGVEISQLIVAAIVLPVVWELRTNKDFLRRGVPACSLAVVLAGGIWLIQRVGFI